MKKTKTKRTKKEEKKEKERKCQKRKSKKNDDNEEEEEEEEEEKKEPEKPTNKQKGKSKNNGSKPTTKPKAKEIDTEKEQTTTAIKNTGKLPNKKRYRVQLEKLAKLTDEERQKTPLPSTGDRVSGKVVKLVRYGMFVDIGLTRDAFLHISQIRFTKEDWDDLLKDYSQVTSNEHGHGHGHERGHEHEHETTDAQAAALRSLPKRVRDMSQVPLRTGDFIEELWVEDLEFDNGCRVTLSQFRPLDMIKVGDYLTGYVRGISSWGVFIDLGFEPDALLDRTHLEAGLMDRLVFDCRHEVKLGQEIKVYVLKVDLESKDKLVVDLDLREKLADHLTLPDDFNESRAVKYSLFGMLPDDINELSFRYLDRGSLHYCRKVCRLFERIIDDKTSLVWDIQELKCFHSKLTFQHEVLGMGVMVERYPGSGVICAIEPKLDLISANSVQAFNVRMSVWKEPFSHWLPVYICPQHGERSLPWAKKVMSEMIDPKKANHGIPFMR
ncbi:hypothetical protein RFI_07454 [Reticulomyxa filosa]|uniref:S1 motif domain-containing protein n=1 Tax=Reticulomyxa filosa TaxID=46433 RepID=X6NWK7_RETFI|nr:hypothetical protein RFI_07454 [Reticulomyxa filosa]|eukprot:ETO29667.1 hypothetical protein RFI_07454 [Reticulomyxa filosa]